MFHLLCIYVSLVVLVRQRRGIDFGTCVVHLDRPERELTISGQRAVPGQPGSSPAVFYMFNFSNKFSVLNKKKLFNITKFELKT
jgi:hypothetical protein